MKKVCVFGCAAAVLVGLSAPALSGPSYDAFVAIMEKEGFKKVAAETVDETAETLSVSNLTAEGDGSTLNIGAIIATNPRVVGSAFEADQMVIREASRTNNDVVVGFSKMNVANILISHSGESANFTWDSISLTDAIAMDGAMNAVSMDRLIASRSSDARIFEVGFQGHVSGAVLSSLVPWSLSPVSEDRVPFHGDMTIGVTGVDGAEVRSSLGLSGYGDYAVQFKVSGVEIEKLQEVRGVQSAFDNAVVKEVSFDLKNMSWLDAAISKRGETEKADFITFVSRVLGGVIAGIGTLDDGIFFRDAVSEFMKAPRNVSIKAQPEIRFNNAGEQPKPKSLNIEIYEQ